MTAACVVYDDGDGNYSITFCKELDRLLLEALAATVVRACTERGAGGEAILRMASTAVVTSRQTVPAPIIIRGEAG